MDKTIKTLTEAIQLSKEGTKPYDAVAEVVRVEGDTAWCHIVGGIDETPVRMTIAAQEGDTVQVRVSGGRAWITGNQSAPPTDDTVAHVANKSAKEAKKTADDAQVMAENAEEVASKANEAARNVNQYFWHTETDTGAGAGAHITEIPKDEFLDDPNNGGGNLLAQSGGVYARDGLFVLAKFGAETIIGQVCRTTITDGKFLVETDLNKYIELAVNGTGLYTEIIEQNEIDMVFFQGGYKPHFQVAHQIGTIYTVYAIGKYDYDYKGDTVSDRAGDVWIDDSSLTIEDFPNGIMIRYGEPSAAEVSTLNLKASDIILLPTTGTNYLKLSSSKTELGGDVETSGDITAGGDIYIGANKLTDYVIERGTSGNWKYIKWHSGRVEAEGYVTFSSLTFSTRGSLYRSPATAFTIPSGIFDTAPSEGHAWIQSGSASDYFGAVIGSLTATGGNCMVWKATSGTGSNISVHMRLIYRG